MANGRENMVLVEDKEAATDQEKTPRPSEKSYEKARPRPAPPPYPVSRLVVRRRASRASA